MRETTTKTVKTQSNENQQTNSLKTEHNLIPDRTKDKIYEVFDFDTPYK